MEKFSLLFATVLGQVLCSSVCGGYRGAVVEYHPVNMTNDLITMNTNAKNYIDFIKLAKSKEVDIIVFPELGLYNSDVLSPIPDPSDKIAPCDVFETTKAVKDLSCAAKDNKIYVVINLLEKRKCEVDDKYCPPKGFYKLNTNVVFNRDGVVIARYAKFNIYEMEGDKTKDPEVVYFDTDFGVRFGTFVCFDILYPVPAQRLVQQYHITDFVFSTMWFSELPFLTALQAQRGWSEAHNVNLLASGVNNPILGSSGSGIYNGRFGHLTQIMLEVAKSKLLIADIPKMDTSTCSDVRKQKTPASLLPLSLPSQTPAVFEIPGKSFFFSLKDKSSSGLTLLSENLENYTSEIITPGKNFRKTICSKKDFCCEFNIHMEALDKDSRNFTWRAIVFNGIRKFGTYHFAAIQTCAVLACKGPAVQNCSSRVMGASGLFLFKEISIKGNFKLRNSFQMPSTLTDGNTLEPLPTYKYEFLRTEKENSAEVSLELLWPVTDLCVFSIWGRDFGKDGYPDTSTASAVVSVSLLSVTLFVSVLLFS